MQGRDAPPGKARSRLSAASASLARPSRPAPAPVPEVIREPPCSDLLRPFKGAPRRMCPPTGPPGPSTLVIRTRRTRANHSDLSHSDPTQSPALPVAPRHPNFAGRFPLAHPHPAGDSQLRLGRRNQADQVRSAVRNTCCCPALGTFSPGGKGHRRRIEKGFIDELMVFGHDHSKQRL